jgi:hypothetical protein
LGKLLDRRGPVQKHQVFQGPRVCFIYQNTFVFLPLSPAPPFFLSQNACSRSTDLRAKKSQGMDEQVDRLVNKTWEKFQHLPRSKRLMIAVSGIPGSGKGHFELQWKDDC